MENRGRPRRGPRLSSSSLRWAGGCSRVIPQGRRRSYRRGHRATTASVRGDSMFVRAIAGWLACSIAGLFASSAALAAVPHTVLPGETLWSISAANNLTTRTVAVYNGLPEAAQLLVGTTVYVPTVQEGAAALASGAPTVAPPTVGSGTQGTGAIGTPET